jgi:hypothetical protein
LNFPPWFPPYIEADARYFHAKAITLGFAWKVAMIERLVGDARMERVWSELLKRQRDKYRKSERFLHRAIPPEFARPVGPIDAQQAALREAFVRTLQTAEDFKLLEKSERDAVTEIAVSMRERFGLVMHKLTATIATVALERDITESKVREWTRPQRNSTPGKNP